MKISADKLRLYAVTDSARLNGRSLAEVVREAIEGGATVDSLSHDLGKAGYRGRGDGRTVPRKE